MLTEPRLVPIGKRDDKFIRRAGDIDRVGDWLTG